MNVLACIDRSQHAGSVCDHAVWNAQRLKASVELLHVIERHPEVAAPMDHSGRLGVDTGEALLHELASLDERRNRLAHKSGHLLLEDAASRVRSQGLEEITQRLVHGELVDHVRDHERDAALVVVGKRGEAGTQTNAHLGRNLERVIRASYRPVMVTAESYRPIRRFVFAYDGGKSAASAIGFLIETGLLNDLEGHVLMAGQAGDTERTHLADATWRLRAAGLTVTDSMRAGDPARVVIDAVDSEEADLLVMGAYGHSRIRSTIIGSTTTEVMQTCPVSMLVCR